jgi:DNA-binding PadR family transcriptional regulator
VNLPEVYRALNRLAAEGWIEAVGDELVPSRKAYRITPDGKEHLDAFLLQPPADLPHPVRQELAVKLLFSDGGSMETLVRVIGDQRDFYMDQLRALSTQRRRLQRLPVDSFFANLMIDGIEGVVRAEIEWLEKVSQKLTERFGAIAV